MQMEMNTEQGIQPVTQETARSLTTRYGTKNLRFITDLLDALGHTPHSYANLTDNPSSTSTSLRIFLHRDDIKVSKAKTIVDTLGYMLIIRLYDRLPEIAASPDRNYVVKIPKEIDQATQGNSKYPNLGFLDDYMKRHKLSRRGLAEKLQLSPGAVFTWFKQDDIAVSYLNKIKDTFDAVLEFNIRKKLDN